MTIYLLPKPHLHFTH